MSNINNPLWQLFKGVQANLAAVQSEVNETGCTPDEAVSRLSQESKLALNPHAQAVWQEHIAKNPGQRHTAGFVAWAETYLHKEEEREQFTLEMDFPDLIGKPIEVLRAEKQRSDLIDEICDLLRSPDGTGRGGKYSSFNIQAVRRQMVEGQWSLEKLIARRAEIVREQALAAKPIAELKQMVHAHYNPPATEFPGWPKLPETMYDNATRSWIAVDRAYLEMIARHDLFQFKRLVKLYGPWVDHRRGL